MYSTPIYPPFYQSFYPPFFTLDSLLRLNHRHILTTHLYHHIILCPVLSLYRSSQLNNYPRIPTTITHHRMIYTLSFPSSFSRAIISLTVSVLFYHATSTIMRNVSPPIHHNYFILPICIFGSNLFASKTLGAVRTTATLLFSISFFHSILSNRH